MTRACVLSMVVSVDGYINGPGGEFIPPAWSADLDADPTMLQADAALVADQSPSDQVRSTLILEHESARGGDDEAVGLGDHRGVRAL